VVDAFVLLDERLDRGRVEVLGPFDAELL